MDAPKPGETIRGNYSITGWALDETGIRDVSIYIDRILVGTAKLGVSRPDLVANFSAFPDAETGGFEYVWNSAGLPPGPHELVVQARSKNGATRDVGGGLVTTAP